jgi:lauroyl/myristoyl acyltransferase
MDTHLISRDCLTQGLDDLFAAIPHPVLVKTAQFIALSASMPPLVNKRPMGDVIEEVLGPLPPAERALITGKIALNEYRNICLDRVRELGGFAAIAELVQCPEAHKLQALHTNRQPAILAFAHLGPRFAGGPALHRIGVPAAIFIRALGPDASQDSRAFASRLPGMEYLEVGASVEDGAFHMKRALQRLRGGGIVAMAFDLDVSGKARLAGQYLRRRISVARGPALLARLSGAPIIPIVPAFLPSGLGIELRIGDLIPRPLAGPTDVAALEQALIQGVLHWFEAYVRAAPEQMRIRQLGLLAQAPRIDMVGPAFAGGMPLPW